ncbi:MAG: hypothetical protein GEU28_13780 [Dehalococcoidia bacterium]|nr:hypothetical protein [Dehalococcoidia bacterium]
MRRALMISGYVLGLYLIVRAIAEPFVIDMTNPATYRNDWGGPSLLAAAVIGWHIARRYARQQS